MSPAASTDVSVKPQKVDFADVPSLRTEIISGDLSKVKPVFSRDSKFLYCGSGREILKYSVSSESLVSVLFGHEDAVTGLCLNSDGDLVSCGLDGTVREWKGDVCSKVHNLDKPIRFMDSDKARNVWFVVLEDEGATPAYPKGTLCEFDLATGKVYAHVYAGCIHAMQVSPSGRFAAAIVGGHAGRLLVNCRSEKVTREWRQPLRGASHNKLTSLAFHPADDHVATGDQCGRIRRWYVFSGEGNSSLVGPGEREAVKSEQHWHCTAVKGLAFAGSSDVLISVAGEAVLCQWTSPSQRHPGVLPRIARSGAAQMAVGPAAQGLVAVVGKGNSVSIVDVNNNQLKSTLYGMATIEAAPEEGTRKDNKRATERSAVEPSSSSCCLTALEDNAVLVSSPAFTDIQVFDAVELRLADEIVPLVARNFVTTAWQTGSKTAIPAVPWVVSATSGSSDGSWLVGALYRPSALEDEGDETLLKFWDRKANRLHTVCVSPHNDRITALLPITRKLPAMAADGSETEQLFASASRDGTISVWGLVKADDEKAGSSSSSRWELRASLGWRGHTTPRAMTSDKDGSVLVAAFDKYVTIWALDTYSELTAGRIHLSMLVRGVHLAGTRLYCLTASKGVSLLTSVDLLTLKIKKVITFHGKASSLSGQPGESKMFVTCPRKVLCFAAPSLKIVSSVPLPSPAVDSCVLASGLVLVWDQSGKVLKMDPDSPIEGVTRINAAMPVVEEGVEEAVEDSKMLVDEEPEEEEQDMEDLIDAMDQWNLVDERLGNVNVMKALNSVVEPTAPSHICPLPSKLLPSLLDQILGAAGVAATTGSSAIGGGRMAGSLPTDEAVEEFGAFLKGRFGGIREALVAMDGTSTGTVSCIEFIDYCCYELHYFTSRGDATRMFLGLVGRIEGGNGVLSIDHPHLEDMFDHRKKAKGRGRSKRASSGPRVYYRRQRSGGGEPSEGGSENGYAVIHGRGGYGWRDAPGGGRGRKVGRRQGMANDKICDRFLAPVVCDTPRRTYSYVKGQRRPARTLFSSREGGARNSTPQNGPFAAGNPAKEEASERQDTRLGADGVEGNRRLLRVAVLRTRAATGSQSKEGTCQTDREGSTPGEGGGREWYEDIKDHIVRDFLKYCLVKAVLCTRAESRIWTCRELRDDAVKGMPCSKEAAVSSTTPNPLLPMLRNALSSGAVRMSSSMATAAALKKTALYDFHLAHGAKMVDFAGWAMPVQYKDTGIITSCLHTRAEASLFDVSHMGQLRVFGKDRVRFMESLTVGDLAILKPGEGRLTLLTTPQSTIIDDTVVCNEGDHLYVVLNASNTDKDMLHIEKALEEFDGEVSLQPHPEASLIALQGPKAMEVLQTMLNEDLTKVPFMVSFTTTVNDIPNVTVTRCGYTGEDGFEVSIPTPEGANAIAERMIDDETVLPAGLGARDTLRIEAGLCLYGHDISESTTVAEAALGWTVSKRRRNEANFPGAEIFLQQAKKGGVDRKRVGLLVTGPPAREGSPILNTEGEKIGEVTSGTFSPTLNRPVAMGYVKAGYTKSDTVVQTEVRSKINEATVTKMPFVEANYYKVSFLFGPPRVEFSQMEVQLSSVGCFAKRVFVFVCRLEFPQFFTDMLSRLFGEESQSEHQNEGAPRGGLQRSPESMESSGGDWRSEELQDMQMKLDSAMDRLNRESTMGDQLRAALSNKEREAEQLQQTVQLLQAEVNRLNTKQQQQGQQAVASGGEEEEIKRLRNRVEEQEEKITALQAALQGTPAAAAGAKSVEDSEELERLRSTVQKYREELDKRDVENSDLQLRLSEAEVAKQKAEEAAEEASSSNNQDAVDAADVEKLQGQLQLAEDRLAEAEEAKVEQRKEFDSKAVEAQQAMEELQQELKEAHEAHAAATEKYEARIDELERTSSPKRDGGSSMASSYEVVDFEPAQGGQQQGETPSKEELRMAEEDKASLRSQLNESSEKVEELQSDVEYLQQQVDDLTSKLKESEAGRQRTLQELSEATLGLREQQKSAEEGKAKADDEAEALQRELEAKEDTYNALLQEVGALKGQVEEQAKELVAMATSKATSNIEEHEAEVKGLKEQLQQAVGRANLADGLEEELSDAQMSLTEAQDRETELQGELGKAKAEAAEAAEEVERLNGKVSSLEANVTELTKELEEYRSKNLEEVCATLRGDVESLKEELSKANEEMEEDKQRAAAANEALVEARKQLSEAEADGKSHEEEIEELKSRLEEMHQEFAKAQDDLCSAESMIEEYDQDNRVKGEHIDKLTEALDARDDLIKQLTDYRDLLVKDVAVLGEEAENRADLATDYHKQLKALHEQLAAAKEQGNALAEAWHRSGADQADKVRSLAREAAEALKAKDGAMAEMKEKYTTLGEKYKELNERRKKEAEEGKARYERDVDTTRKQIKAIVDKARRAVKSNENESAAAKDRTEAYINSLLSLNDRLVEAMKASGKQAEVETTKILSMLQTERRQRRSAEEALEKVSAESAGQEPSAAASRRLAVHLARHVQDLNATIKELKEKQGEEKASSPSIEKSDESAESIESLQREVSRARRNRPEVGPPPRATAALSSLIGEISATAQEGQKEAVITEEDEEFSPSHVVEDLPTTDADEERFDSLLSDTGPMEPSSNCSDAVEFFRGLEEPPVPESPKFEDVDLEHTTKSAPPDEGMLPAIPSLSLARVDMIRSDTDGWSTQVAPSVAGGHPESTVGEMPPAGSSRVMDEASSDAWDNFGISAVESSTASVAQLPPPSSSASSDMGDAWSTERLGSIAATTEAGVLSSQPEGARSLEGVDGGTGGARPERARPMGSTGSEGDFGGSVSEEASEASPEQERDDHQPEATHGMAGDHGEHRQDSWDMEDWLTDGAAQPAGHQPESTQDEANDAATAQVDDEEEAPPEEGRPGYADHSAHEAPSRTPEIVAAVPEEEMMPSEGRELEWTQETESNESEGPPAAAIEEVTAMGPETGSEAPVAEGHHGSPASSAHDDGFEVAPDEGRQPEGDTGAQPPVPHSEPHNLSGVETAVEDVGRNPTPWDSPKASRGETVQAAREELTVVKDDNTEGAKATPWDDDNDAGDDFWGAWEDAEPATTHTEETTVHVDDTTTHSEESATAHIDEATAHLEPANAHGEEATAHLEPGNAHGGEATVHLEPANAHGEEATVHAEYATSRPEEGVTGHMEEGAAAYGEDVTAHVDEAVADATQDATVHTEETVAPQVASPQESDEPKSTVVTPVEGHAEPLVSATEPDDAALQPSSPPKSSEHSGVSKDETKAVDNLWDDDEVDSLALEGWDDHTGSPGHSAEPPVQSTSESFWTVSANINNEEAPQQSAHIEEGGWGFNDVNHAPSPSERTSQQPVTSHVTSAPAPVPPASRHASGKEDGKQQNNTKAASNDDLDDDFWDLLNSA
ncbi:hypothetical protein FOL47_003791 [Perkinsus chesapeaki]|uniref:aminomethyltransferase n=1 Tax=Perkinsus chesapeaki TaxID=330153 RepID=A0A7J6M6H1_PERCH|nr:hypothetical protein FOL47_003791 [Perkinsus chesapeaki]